MHRSELSHESREAVVRVLAAAALIIFFQAYLVAPLIPSLANDLHSTQAIIGLLVPAYTLPYGISTLFYGPLSDRVGRRKVLLILMAVFILALLGTATARTGAQLLAWRVVAGLASGGVIPISLALIGDLFPYKERGRPMGWIFGAIAGGMAFGSTFGAMLNPIIGWRWEFVALAVPAGLVLWFAIRLEHALHGKASGAQRNIIATLRGYWELLQIKRARRAYLYILFNGMFHSGIFSWLGLYFSQRYHLSDQGIGLALLGYGVPGLMLGPTIGHIADRFGRNRVVPFGLLIAAVSAYVLVPTMPVLITAAAVTVLSLGYDMSHPLLAGIISSVDPSRVGQAMGLNAFFVFMGLGFGSLVFQAVLTRGFTVALWTFATAQLIAAGLGYVLFRNESPTKTGHL